MLCKLLTRKKLYVIGVVLLLLGVYVSIKQYKELPCTTRWATESTYYRHHGGDGLVNATFTIEELETLTVEEACPQ